MQKSSFAHSCSCVTSLMMDGFFYPKEQLQRMRSLKKRSLKKILLSLKKKGRDDQITTVQQVSMSQLSCSNHSWACLYLKGKANLQGKAQPAMKEGKVMCVILHLPQA